MNANAFRQLYDYHFSANRGIWDEHVVSLPDAQFTQPVDYSVGSVRNQVVHMLNVDGIWFSDLLRLATPLELEPANSNDRALIRRQWDTVEAHMRRFLDGLTDDMLFEKPFAEGEDKDLILWQVLLHVANHGTDHRAQLLRLLHDLGCQTGPQDFVFYAYDQIEPGR